MPFSRDRINLTVSYDMYPQYKQPYLKLLPIKHWPTKFMNMSEAKCFEWRTFSINAICHSKWGPFVRRAWVYMLGVYGVISELILDHRVHPVIWNVRGRGMVVQCRGKRFLFSSKFRQTYVQQLRVIAVFAPFTFHWNRHAKLYWLQLVSQNVFFRMYTAQKSIFWNIISVSMILLNAIVLQ